MKSIYLSFYGNTPGNNFEDSYFSLNLINNGLTKKGTNTCRL